MGPASKIIQVDKSKSDAHFKALEKAFYGLRSNYYVLNDFDCYFQMFMKDADHFLTYYVPTKTQREIVEHMKQQATEEKEYVAKLMKNK